MFNKTSPMYDPCCMSPMEQIAKIHAEIKDFMEKHPYEDVEEFEKTIACIMQNYIASLDLKLAEFRTQIRDVVGLHLAYSEENEEIIVEEGV